MWMIHSLLWRKLKNYCSDDTHPCGLPYRYHCLTYLPTSLGYSKEKDPNLLEYDAVYCRITSRHFPRLPSARVSQTLRFCYLSDINEATRIPVPPPRCLQKHTDLRSLFQLVSLGSQTLLAPEAGDFVDLMLLYSTKFSKSCLLTSSGYSKMKESSLLISCVHWYTGTQVSEEMYVPVFKVLLGSRMQSSWDMRSASIFGAGATLKVDAAKAHKNPHDVISQTPGVLTSAAVITSYLINTILLLPTVIHCPSVPWPKHTRQYYRRWFTGFIGNTVSLSCQWKLPILGTYTRITAELTVWLNVRVLMQILILRSGKDQSPW